MTAEKITVAIWLVAAACIFTRPPCLADQEDASFDQSPRLGRCERKAQKCFNKGHEALNKGEAARAEGLYRKAIKLHPDDPRYHRQLALLLVNLNRGQEAEREALLALSLDPEDWRTMLALGSFYHLQKRYDEEVEIYKKVLDHVPAAQQTIKERIERFLDRDREARAKSSEMVRKQKEHESKMMEEALLYTY